MALFQCDFYSNVLGMATSMNVILPGGPAGERLPAMFLLHGLSDDHTIWLRRTSIERYAEAYGIAVVMPNVHRGFYTDMKQGFPYWRFISEEVPALAQSWFPLSRERESTFAAGLSMGGYGAFKLALRCPDRFAAGASLSGALDMVNRWEDYDFFPDQEYRRIFGSREELAGSEDDLFFVAEKLAASGAERPKLFQCCGTEDFLYDANVKFRDHARRLGFDHVYEEGPGSHEWGYWDRNIQRVLEWLPLGKR
ncbi:esterase family protein [Cohnella sp. CFH 77786]|uniref:alpha/beta hydrolase n=1 Tax=Cohnella sp. CFH 77786 TaxID=2662265 RepID=UPI001C60AC96|nr:alpha/beta hydrolase family protein [Cohnella sp. CFH 77786]MBW5447087.1 esterase family protein [Cohnella sp. CFH 77786]